MNILEQLWYGNLDPQIIPVETDSELEVVEKEAAVCFDELMIKLPNELKELFEKERELHTAANALREVEVFKQGFRYGMQIAVEAFSSNKQASSDQ